MTYACSCGLTTTHPGPFARHKKICGRVWTVESLLEFGRVDSSNPDGCWVWNRGKLAARGTYAKAPNDRAHRLMFKAATGIDPGGNDVMHSCDNPPCVNPKHLSLGTRSENIADCVSKGRHFTPWR